MDKAPARAGQALSIQELEAQITTLAGHLNAAHHRWLLLIAEFDRRHGWSDGATQSCAHWLNWRCGIDLGAAREKVRVAHALEKLPRISSAMARGQLSYSKVRALTRVASETTEELLLSIAQHGTAVHVENVVRHFRRASEAESLSQEARQQADRRVSYFFDEHGSLVLKASLPAESGLLFVKALEAAVDTMPPPANAAAQSASSDISAETTPLAARRADALGIVAESFLKHGAGALSGGERHQIVVHVDAAALRDGSGERCELETGAPVASETARRLACDASIVNILEDEQGTPLDVGRKTRSIPPALRRALNARDRGCCFPGCPNTRYVDAHHVLHWAHGGETKLSNLVTLCRFHHQQVHEGRVRIERLDDGAWRFVRPDGRSFDATGTGTPQPSGDWQQLLAAHHEQGIQIDSHTAVSAWRGETMDYGMAIDALLHRARLSRNVSAERSRGTPN